ncbi:hypothetical protein ACFL1C_09790 [Pseudomonadota bacterium]
MNRSNLIGIFLFTLMFFSSSVFAVNSVLSGVFDGSEQKTAALPGTCLTEEPLGYLEAGTFQVSASGTYFVVEAYNFIGVDVSALIYADNFDPNFPQANLVTPDGVDVADLAVLSAGVTYILVVQQWCTNPDRIWVNREGAWSVTLTGPGNVTSDLKVSVPAFSDGGYRLRRFPIHPIRAGPVIQHRNLLLHRLVDQLRCGYVSANLLGAFQSGKPRGQPGCPV